MYLKQRILAVIPARGGSRGIPDKNVVLLAGRPLLTHTIDTALAVGEFDRIVVSTNDPKIAAVAEACGVSVVRRPDDLATADAPTEWAVLHALDSIVEAGDPPFDYVAVLEPTTPFRTVATIQGAIRSIVANGARSLLTVSEIRESIGRIESGIFRPLQKPRRRQDREPLYVECGAIYLCRVDHLRQTRSLVTEDWLAFVVDSKEAVDINEPLDLIYAEAVAEQRRARRENP